METGVQSGLDYPSGIRAFAALGLPQPEVASVYEILTGFLLLESVQLPPVWRPHASLPPHGKAACEKLTSPALDFISLADDHGYGLNFHPALAVSMPVF